MKHLTKMGTWLAVAVLLILLITACGPAAAPDATVETEDAPTVEAPATPEVGEEEPAEEETGQLPTIESGAGESSPPPTVEVPEDAITLDGGSYYVEVEEGEGAAPQEGDLISFHFVGTLADGTVLADTHQAGEPVTIPFGIGAGAIPAWDDALGMMKEGGTATLIVPPDSEDAAAVGVPGGSAITFELELLSVTTPDAPTEVAEGDYETTDSGVKYYELEEGDGATPATGDMVSMDFTLWLQEGNQYIASSSDVGQPVEVPLGSGQLFPGWEEGVSTMQVGGKRQLVIPPDQAFGDAGSGIIPPDATIVMEVELLSVTERPQPTEVDEDEFTTTESGLQYYDLEEGDGPSPEEGDQVTVHYSGWTEDGVLFDSSVERGTPATFTLAEGSVISGWVEGVASMQVGGKRQLIIPPELGYGETGNPAGGIPPNATLIFEVELLEITPSE